MKNLKDKMSHITYTTFDAMQRARQMVCPIRMSIALSRRFDEHDEWCRRNLENDYILFSDAIYTKTEEDAMAFKLRWI